MCCCCDALSLSNCVQPFAMNTYARGWHSRHDLFLSICRCSQHDFFWAVGRSVSFSIFGLFPTLAYLSIHGEDGFFVVAVDTHHRFEVLRAVLPLSFRFVWFLRFFAFYLFTSMSTTTTVEQVPVPARLTNCVRRWIIFSSDSAAVIPVEQALCTMAVITASRFTLIARRHLTSIPRQTHRTMNLSAAATSCCSVMDRTAAGALIPHSTHPTTTRLSRVVVLF